MKANELSCKDIMVGDWVIPHVFDAKLEPSKIVGIHYNSYKGLDYVDWVDCGIWDELSLSDIEPIPLTPEILEKNGFTYIIVLGEVAPKLENFVLDNHWEGDGYSWNGIPLLYVHQLQHALRLCGIEKEIEL